MSTSAMRSPKVLFLMASGSGFQFEAVNVLQSSFDGRRSGEIPRDRVIEGLLHGRTAGGIKRIAARHRPRPWLWRVSRVLWRLLRFARRPASAVRYRRGLPAPRGRWGRFAVAPRTPASRARKNRR